MVSRETIIKQITQMVNDMISEENKPLLADDDILASLCSLEFITLLLGIETTFSIELIDSDFEINKLNTINRLADLVLKHSSEG